MRIFAVRGNVRVGTLPISFVIKGIVWKAIAATRMIEAARISFVEIRVPVKSFIALLETHATQYLPYFDYNNSYSCIITNL